jgi:uncharacterized protein YqeY
VKPEWPALVAGVAPMMIGVVLAVASDKLRQILGSIFWRPREDSLIVHLDDKRLEITESQRAEIERAVIKTARERGLSEARAAALAASVVASLAIKGKPMPTPSGEASVSAGGTSDE